MSEPVVSAARGTEPRKSVRPLQILALAVGLLLAVAVVGSIVSPYDPFDSVADPLQPPSGSHWLGTDDLGRDLLSGILLGLRTSILVGVSVAASSLALGGAVGLVSGYLGGRIDDLLMRATELVQILPRFFLALLVVALFGSSLINLIAVLALTNWAITARVMRARVVVVKQVDFVRADRLTGAGPYRIMTRSILPNVLAPVVALVALQFGSAILVEAGLSFLGLGDPNVMSLGQMLSRAQPFIRVAWWMAVFPGVALALTILSVNLVADTIERVRDPRGAAAF